MPSIENQIREQLNPTAEKEEIAEVYPGFGKNREASPTPQGGSSKPGYQTLVKGGGSDAAVKAAAATSLTPSSGPMDKTSPKQGSSADAPFEDLGADEPGKKASEKMKETGKKPTGKGAGAAPRFKTFVDPQGVVNQKTSKGNVYKEETEDDGITEDEYNELSAEEQAEYSPVETEEYEYAVDEGLTAEEYEALSEEEKAEYEVIDEKCDDDEEEDDEDDKKSKKKKFFGKEELEADVKALFGEESTLTEEFKNKAASLFEAVVTARIASLQDALAEEALAAADEAVEGFVEEMTDKVDAYLNYVVEQWLEQNEVGVVDGLRAEITEEFIDGLKNLFTEHYIEVPDEKYDLIGEMASHINELESALNEQISSAVELTNDLTTAKRDAVVAAVTEGLAQTEVEKFSSLIEDVTFEDERSFAEKLTVLKNNYFPKTAGSTVPHLYDEEAVAEDVEVAPGMEKYTSALSRGVPKFNK